ncbi:MAG: hypothetical protein A3F16_00770 [Deltaproteobacteria bacterium RIFCSPHIGHO2_12_FULL_43_9]|nr:MAG: hypothetical protein A3F16_00770 [Deltaproteobacteria bacterium RIFCSPHIGHO2_12_FULL_43_9]
MHPRTLLTLDLVRSFPRADHKLSKLLAYTLYMLDPILGDRLSVASRWRGAHPLHAFILLTTRCNMSCEDCFFVDVINDKSVGHLDYNLDEIKKVYKSGLFNTVSRVILYGGEPTLCKDLYPIIRFFRQRGIVVSMTSNVIRIDRKILEELKSADLNMLNLSIYKETSRGVRRNLEYIEKVLEDARSGAFDPERIEISYHGVDVESYRWAYDFAKQVGARHLLFNRTFYTDYNPKDGGFAENEEFADEYVSLCRRIEKEKQLNFYHATYRGTPNTCSFTTNAFAVGPVETLSPCCMVTPDKKFGSISEPGPLIDFKNGFLSKQVPNLCKECHLLGTKHF